MIERPTVLVLGAGASAPYGLPLGSGLRQRILALSPNEVGNVPTGSGMWVNKGDGANFIQAFGRSQFYSIDSFLGHRQDFVSIGKHAIARVLLPSENIATLLDSDPVDNWYRYLLNAMEAPWSRFAENQLSVITFNYDRSLEVVLEHALAARFDKSPEEAREMVSKFEIMHVYGSLGSTNPLAENYVPYGGGENLYDLMHRAIAGLVVIPEGRDDSQEFTRAKKLLQNAEALCFLGFGFDPTNIRRLGGPSIGAAGAPTAGGWRTTRFAGTALGLTPMQRSVAAGRIALDRAKPEALGGLQDMGCLDLLRHSLVLESW